MNTLIRVTNLIFLICMTSITSIAQEKPFEVVKPELMSLSSDSLKNMNAHFHRLVDEKQLAGIQTAILRKGKLVHFDSYGYANIEEGKPLDKHHIFRIFSMTKPIVSVALMQLYEEGKFRLEDPLYKFIPEFKKMNIHRDSVITEAKNPIRIIDLLRHTSGFNYGRGPNAALNQLYADANLYTSKTNKEFVLKLSKLPILFEPGTDWQYGLSTNICGYLVELFSGKSLDAYLRERVFGPLAMKDTHFQLPKEKIERFTVGYGWQEGTGLHISQAQRDNRYVREVTLFNGGGGLVSTTFDYLKFCQMLLNKGTTNGHRLLKEETVALLFKDHLQEVKNYQERFRLPLGEYGFGLGFAIRGKSENELEKVYGWGGAVGTYFKIDVANDMAYVMMIQLSPYRQLGLRQLFQDYVASSIIE
ncbi:serine hydrolase domain-containing protein [Aquimarina litoralis]|uniref:serine hydrolase domain-containing protein n=1 Tax=Aquimarina litoralis TaxID=584605 RepID=UPI001C57CBCC|nr:serine hydrolase domain-containing protein [Aquimarina litoralis]MBW1294962.1 serine hydrolase [Aquimarina litoralis]